MLYVQQGQLETGQVVFSCGHALSPVHGFVGGNGEEPLVVEFSEDLLRVVGTFRNVGAAAIAFSRRTVVIWCRDCYDRGLVADVFRDGPVPGSAATLMGRVREGD